MGKGTFWILGMSFSFLCLCMGVEPGKGGELPSPALKPVSYQETPASMAVRMMEEARRKEQEVLQREQEVKTKEERLGALKQELESLSREVDKREKELKASLEKSQDGKEGSDGGISQLAKLVEAAAPEQGARLLAGMDPETAAKVISRMNPKKAGRLLGSMEPEKALLVSQALIKSKR
jgi:flagellar motility protein MotE (MotC chaperone)